MVSIMFGHLAHVTNLSLKAILGIGSYAQLCEKTGKIVAENRPQIQSFPHQEKPAPVCGDAMHCVSMAFNFNN
ncbi:hypothetical protein FACS1894123_02910 [Bacteroidia bacterium]|nr:hypothetical protein FACS1894123_02910 [Bacteroidia bacterium]